MSSTQAHWVFICNPAALMHAEWKPYLPKWGVPEKLTEPLWRARQSKGTLTRFLVERFKLGTRDLLHPKIKQRECLLTTQEEFENKLIKMGCLFFYSEIIKTIDGARLRGLKDEFGNENFDFLRGSLHALISPPFAAFIEAFRQARGASFALTRQNALLLGLAFLLQDLPSSSDLITRVCLKLPPLAAQPRPPEGFALVQDQIERARATQRARFKVESLWEKLP